MQQQSEAMVPDDAGGAGANHAPRPARPMITFCSGMPRGGSTWSYNVCRSVITLAATGRRLVCGFVGEGDATNATLEQACAEGSMDVLLKFHLPGARAVEMILDGRAKNVFTHRDPRDAIVSNMTFFGRSFPEALAASESALRLLDLYESESETLVIPYSVIMGAAHHAVARIGAYLGRPLSDAEIDQICDETGIESAHRQSVDYSGRSPTEIVSRDHVTYHRTTLLHEAHVSRGGRSGRWRSELTPDQQVSATRALRPWLLRLGYEQQPSIDAILDASASDLSIRAGRGGEQQRRSER